MTKWGNISYCLLLICVLSFVGSCSNSKDEAIYQRLSYSTGFDAQGQYNDKLYGLNGNDINGANPGCFYVSEEEDGEYGGYYYMYVTSFARNSGSTLNNTEYKDKGIRNLVGRCYRSKELYSWEVAGIYDGYACAVKEDDWCSDLYWAPEVIRDPNTGKYYMYFSANYDPSLKGEGLSSSSNQFDCLTLTVAEGDTPIGPFMVINNIDGVLKHTMNVSDFVTNAQSGATYAFGLYMDTDKPADIRFSQIVMSTETATVNQYMDANK